MGNFSNRLPNQNALDAVDELIAWLERKNFVNKNCYEFAGHRDKNATVCPGDPRYGKKLVSTVYLHIQHTGDLESIHSGTENAKLAQNINLRKYNSQQDNFLSFK